MHFKPSDLSTQSEKKWHNIKDKDIVISTQSPYERLDDNPDLYEILKMVSGAVFLVPLRALTILNLIVVYYVVARLYIFCAPNSKYLRHSFHTFTRMVARSVLFCCGFHYIQVIGNAKIDPEMHVLVSNHISFWEILYFMAAPCCPSFAFKKSCLNIPLLGNVALKVLQGIPIDRGSGGAKAIIDRVNEMEKGEPLSHRPLLIFPEGTTSNGSCLLKFRTGAFVTGSPVQPILIQFPFRHFSPAYESIYTSVTLFRTLCQFYNRLQVKYLDMYVPSEAEKNDPALYAASVRRKMAVAMDVPVCDVGYKEKMKYHGMLEKRLKALPLGWVSNFFWVNPKQLLIEGEPIEYTYRGNQGDIEMNSD